MIAPDGAVDWLCVPRFDSPSVFGTLLDRQAGNFRLGPFGINVPNARIYEPGTNTLLTTWHTPTGWIMVRDALTMGPRTHEDEVTPHTRPPTDEEGDHMLVRTVLCIGGTVEVELICEPVFDYGRTPAEWSLIDRHTADATGAGTTIRLKSDLALGVEGDWVRARHDLTQGEQIYCSLSWAEQLESPQNVDQANERLAATAHYWRTWLGRARIPDHRFREAIQRSALAIKGLTYMPTGATVAAATTSLPETPGGERNWDYRFTWMRDSTFTLQALHYLNLDWEAEEFMQFVADLEPNDDGGLQIMYGIDGRRDLTESTRDDLSGYAGAQPGAGRQRRLRPAPERRLRGGPRLDSHPHTSLGSPAAAAVADRARRRPKCATKVWKQPDQGIWEARGKPQHYVSSKLMCWVALDRASKLAAIGGEPKLEAKWGSVADEIKADILDRGVRDGVLRQHYDTDALDASTLLAAIFGFLPGDDERLRKSVEAIADDLTEDGFVLRYRTGETDDGLSGKEGSFLICSFWLVSALAVVGEEQRARDLMEKLLNVASPLGLYAEEFDAGTGRHLGNFPQAFSHLALIEAGGTDHPRGTARGARSVSDSYDVIVIGSGAGGGTLVHRLAPSGKRILLLERGDWLPREPQNWLAQDVFVDNRYVSPETWYDADGKAFQPQVHYFVGGATKLYGAALYRLREKDFGELRHHDGVSPGMADRLRRAGALLHAGGAALPGARRPRRGPDRATGQRALSLPGGLPRAPHPAALRRPRRRRLPPVPRPLRDHARRGQHALQPLRAVQRLRRLPVPGARQVRCRGAGGAAGARASERHAAHQREGRQARYERGGHRRHRGRRRAGGRDRERFAGDVVVVSCGAANSAKLLQLSASDKHPNGLANGSDQVGRNFMFHDSSAVLALSKEENPTVFQKTLGLNDFYFAGDEFDYPLGNIQMVGKSQAPMFRGEKPGETKLAPEWTLERIARHAVDFWLSTEDLPHPDNRALLDRDGKLTVSYTETNATARKRLYDKLRSMLGHLGMHSDHLFTKHAYMKNDIPVAGCAHQAGTCRFGADPATRCSTPTARRTSSTTSTSSTRASSPASAPSIRGSPRWPTGSGSAITCWTGWGPRHVPDHRVGLLGSRP